MRLVTAADGELRPNAFRPTPEPYEAGVIVCHRVALDNVRRLPDFLAAPVTILGRPSELLPGIKADPMHDTDHALRLALARRR